MPEKPPRQVLQEKLEFLLKEQALAVDPDAKFALAQKIDGLRETLDNLDGESLPEPSYADDTTRALSQDLADAYLRLEELTSAEADTAGVREEILGLRRHLRETGLKPGDFLGNGRFRLLERIGKGGFATVWKAYDKTSRRLVAVKVLHLQYAEDRTRRERFFRGARKMAELGHPNVVRVIEQEFEDGGYPFFVMEYVSGGDLRQAVQEGRLGGEAGLSVIVQVGRALAHAHREGVVHRDVKPANVLLDERGEPRLTDFDLVRALDTTGGTRTGSMLGTFLYAAPEALEDAKEVGVAADVYSLAMTAAFVLHGRGLPSAVLRDAKSFVEGLDCSRAVKDVLVRATAWEAEKRFESVEELLAALEQPAEKPIPPPPMGHLPVPAPPLPREVGERMEESGLAWRYVLADTFQMGSPDGEKGRRDDERLHEVRLTRGFWMAETALTQAQWERLTGNNPSRFRGENLPVEKVNWYEALWYANEMSRRAGLESCYALSGCEGKAGEGLECGEVTFKGPGCEGYRLPTEAEWEYAARAGPTGPFWTGEDLTAAQANYDGNYPYRGAKGEYRQKTVEVGSLPANPWGLYEVHGNVWEWVWDWYGAYEEGAVADPAGPPTGSGRVVRGGSWIDGAWSCRSADRDGGAPGRRFDILGFRLVRTYP